MTLGKKRVFHVIQSLDNGGCENMLLRTLPLVDDFEHTIITLKELGELTPRFVEANIRIVNVHCKNLFDIPGLLRLRTLVKGESPDLVLSYLFHADIAARFILRDIPPVPPIPFLRTTYNHPRYLIARIFEWLTKPLVGRYLANSEAVKNFYVSKIGIPAEKITVIPNGIDTDFFDSINPDPNLRKSLGISPNNFVIICVANLHPNKGHRFLLEAFEKIYQGHTDIHLLLIGDGAEHATLEHQITKYQSKQNIFFLGRRTDVPQLLKIADCFVLPTLFEGMSNAIIEAMAAGLPVITTNIPENKSLIKSGYNGLLVKVKNVEELSQSILLIKNDIIRAQELGQNGRKSIQQSFSIKNIVNDWKNFLSTL